MEQNILKTGTTTVSLVGKDFVVIGADKKSTLGFMVDSKVARKIYPLDTHIAITTAGSVGDALSIIRLLKAQLKLYKLEHGPITVRGAVTLLSNILHANRYFPYFNQFIVAGYDYRGPQIYSVDLLGGIDEKDKFYATGSGSPFAYGVLEAEYKENISQKEAISLVYRAIKAAIERDIGSGGKGVLIAIIDEKGYREIPESEIK
ncbi:MAG TPA: proteasome subunit beta [Nanoarchaeota archaeon]|nr:proteasome subunit beta [Nanoarchaeota archaeon]